MVPFGCRPFFGSFRLPAFYVAFFWFLSVAGLFLVPSSCFLLPASCASFLCGLFPASFLFLPSFAGLSVLPLLCGPSDACPSMCPFCVALLCAPFPMGFWCFLVRACLLSPAFLCCPFYAALLMLASFLCFLVYRRGRIRTYYNRIMSPATIPLCHPYEFLFRLVSAFSSRFSGTGGFRSHSTIFAVLLISKMDCTHFFEIGWTRTNITCFEGRDNYLYITIPAFLFPPPPRGPCRLAFWGLGLTLPFALSVWCLLLIRRFPR